MSFPNPQALVLSAILSCLGFACSGVTEPGPEATPALPAGLGLEVLEPGTGPMPSVTDTVRVHYHGTFPDGRVFDSSVDRGQPATFPLNRVIPCWTLGLQQVRVGSKVQLICPPELAYGASGAGPIPPNATLHFEVELIAIK